MAIQIVREVSADVVKRGSTRAVYAKQNDFNSRFLNVRIQADGTDIEVESTSTVILNVERPDHSENMFYGTVNTDGSVKVPMTSWMLEKAGTLTCDVSIISEDPSEAKLTTMQFNIFVEEAVVVDESFVETEDYSVIVDLLDKATYLEGVAEEASKVIDQAVEATEKAKDATEIAIEAAGGWITKFVEMNTQQKVYIWLGSYEQYEAHVAANGEIPNCLYIYTDDHEYNQIIERLSALETSDAGINEYLKILNQQITNMSKATLSDISGTLPVSKGGTGATSMTSARNNLGMRYEVLTFAIPSTSSFAMLELEAPGVTISDDSVAFAQILSDESTSMSDYLAYCLPVVRKSANKLTIWVRNLSPSGTPSTGITGKLGIMWIRNK